MCLIRLNIRKITNLKKHSLDPKKDVELVIDPKAQLADLIAALPKKTHDGNHQYSLSLVATSDNKWLCYYHNRLTNHNNINYEPCIAKHPETAVRNMLKLFMSKGEYKKLNVIGKR